MLNKQVGIPSSLALLAGTLALPAADASSQLTSQNSLSPAPHETARPSTVTAPSLTTLAFTNTALSQVIDTIADKTGLIIFSATTTNASISLALRGAVSGPPLIDALSSALAPHKIHLELSGRLLKILPEAAARYTGPVTLLSRTTETPKSASIGTLILPLSSIEPAGLITTLQPYLPENCVAIASADANSLVLHGSHRELSRVITIARLLDGAPSSASQISVVPLTYADPSPMAQTVREIFAQGRGDPLTSAPSAVTQATENPPSPRVQTNSRSAGLLAAADTHSNSLIMRGPAAIVYAAELLVHRLDSKRFEASEIHIFRLRNADATEMATVIRGIFPSGSAEEFQVESTTAPQVEHRDDVVAVPDSRSNTLILRAPTSIIPTLGGLIESLDQDSDRKQRVYVFQLSNADPVAASVTLQELFQANGTTGRAGSSQVTSALLRRAQQQGQSIGTTATSTRQGRQSP